MRLKIDMLKTIKNYAMQEHVTPAYIYKLVKAGRMSVVFVDGVQFVDVSKYPALPVTNRR
jgi:hypothetical protein